MRWLSRSVTGLALLAALASGCGSTGDDRLVFHFERWDNTGLTQTDSVRETSADIDVLQDCCAITVDGSCSSFEPFQQTIINAVFRNEQASDIRLDRYVVHVNDKRSGLADISGGITGNIIGGRCSNISDRQCGGDADCAQGSATGNCNHSETTISGILLFDFLAKAAVNPEVAGEKLSVTVTFFASDANQSFVTSGTYAVTFEDFDNCTTSTGGGAGAS